MMNDEQKQQDNRDLKTIDPIENDDFAQDMSKNFDETIDDISFGEEDWNNEEFSHNSFSEDNDALSNKKSEINWFNIGVFGFVGVAAAIIGYDTFMEQSSPTQMTAQPQQIAQPSSTSTTEQNNNLAQQALSTQNDPSTSPLGFLGNPDSLANEENTKEIEKQENANQDLFSVLETPPNYEENIEDILSTLKQPTPPTQNQVEETITNNTQTLPTPADAVKENTDSIDMALPAINEVNAPEKMDNPVAEANSTNVVAIDVSEQTLQDNVSPVVENTTTETPVEIEDQISESSPSPAPSEETITLRSQVNELSSKITEMNSRIEELTNELEAEKQKEDDIVLAPAPTPATYVADEKMAKMAKTIATLEKRVTALSKAKAQTKTSPRPKVTMAPKPKIVWELRGASPNQAYVAQKGTQNLRTISAGDSLEGIGRIKSIAIENNRWVVRGTSGKIVQ